MGALIEHLRALNARHVENRRENNKLAALKEQERLCELELVVQKECENYFETWRGNLEKAALVGESSVQMLIRPGSDDKIERLFFSKKAFQNIAEQHGLTVIFKTETEKNPVDGTNVEVIYAIFSW